MNAINISEIQKEAVHPQLLEAIITLRTARKQIERLTKDEEISTWVSRVKTLIDISEGLMNYENELSDIIGCLLPERVEQFMRKTEEGPI